MMVAARRLYLITVLIVVFVTGVMYFIRKQSTPGGYSSWTEWSVCTRTCGLGLQGKIRKCNNPTPGPLGKRCFGANVITRKCKDAPCPIDGGLSDWSEFGNCDKSCGGGIRKRVRTCTNPSPLFGGKDCAGAPEETERCNTQPCPVNGGFSDWSDFSKCVVDSGNCGLGKKNRTRSCNKPTPAYGGKQCEGPLSETHACEVVCPTTQPTTLPSTIGTINGTTNGTVVPAKT